MANFNSTSIAHTRQISQVSKSAASFSENIQGLSFIAAPITAAVPHRKPVNAATSRDAPETGIKKRDVCGYSGEWRRTLFCLTNMVYHFLRPRRRACARSP